MYIKEILSFNELVAIQTIQYMYFPIGLHVCSMTLLINSWFKYLRFQITSGTSNYEFTDIISNMDVFGFHGKYCMENWICRQKKVS